MPVYTMLIFGLRTDRAITLTVTTKPLDPLPELAIRKSGQSSDVVVPYNENKWAIELTAGDHAIRLRVGEGSAPPGRVEFQLGAPATIITADDKESTKPIFWVAESGAVDPKYPWPRPLAVVPVREPALLPDPAWFNETLAEMSAEIAVARSAPHARSSPSEMSP